MGTVTDANGAPISGAKIVVTNSNTGVDRETLTDTEGNFQVAQLPIGSYRVSAEHSSFQKVVTGAQLLQFNESVRFDIRMEAGDARQTVQVEAQATQQNMDTADLYPTQTIEKPHAVYIAPGGVLRRGRGADQQKTDATIETCSHWTFLRTNR